MIFRPVRVVFLSLLAAALLLASCSVAQRVLIRTDGSGSTSLSIELGESFVDYIKELSELMGEPVQDDIFKIDEIEEQFAADPNLVLEQVTSPNPNTLKMKLAFREVEGLFSEEKRLASAGILTFMNSAGNHRLRVHLDRENFNQIQTLFPFLQNPLFEGLGPQENDNTTEEEYLELIELAMGEEGARGLESSYLDIFVQVEGEILSQTGGTVEENGIRFRVPLIKVLLLEKPLDYSISFR